MLVEAVLPSRFPAWVRQRTFSVVFLGHGVVRRPSLAVQGLENLYPQQVVVGWMQSDAMADLAWWNRHWVTELGPYQRDRVPPPGVYLFHLGYVAGYSPATAHAGTDTDWLRVRQYLAERMKLKSSQGADDTEWTRTSTSGKRERAASPPPPPPPRRLADEGPYELLEVSPDASDDDVKKAYRTALKLNHPDRVAHLSKAIQQFAQDRTQRIVEAWKVVKQERGIP